MPHQNSIHQGGHSTIARKMSTVLYQGKPTPENPSQTRPIPIRANRHTPVQSTLHSGWVPEKLGTSSADHTNA